MGSSTGSSVLPIIFGSMQATEACTGHPELCRVRDNGGQDARHHCRQDAGATEENA